MVYIVEATIFFKTAYYYLKCDDLHHAVTKYEGAKHVSEKVKVPFRVLTKVVCIAASRCVVELGKIASEGMTVEGIRSL